MNPLYRRSHMHAGAATSDEIFHERSERLSNDDSEVHAQCDEIHFYDRTEQYCVCFMDIVNSTKVTAQIDNRNKIRSYYTTFLNFAAALARGFGARIIKNVGDGLLFYFPETSDSTNRQAFENVLRYCTTSTASNDTLNMKMHSQHLPSISYRISADYGKVEMAATRSSNIDDLFGLTVNICVKINSMAVPNGIVVGGDLYAVLTALSLDKGGDYCFEETRMGYSIDLRQNYPVYALTRKDNTFRNDIGELFMKGTNLDNSN